MTEEIPINCKICKFLIQDYDAGEFICNFGSPTSILNLLNLGECDEFKIGKIRLVEFLEKILNRLDKLEEKIKKLEEK